ncbi:MAG: hypothetical protein QXU54_02000 [Candidatus Micrarchaeia archaeon]
MDKFDRIVNKLAKMGVEGRLLEIRKFDIDNTDPLYRNNIDAAYIVALNKLASQGRYDEITIFGNIWTYMQLGHNVKAKLIDVLGEAGDYHVYLSSYYDNEQSPELRARIERHMLSSIRPMWERYGPEYLDRVYLRSTNSDTVRKAVIDLFIANGYTKPVRELLAPDKYTAKVSDELREYAQRMLSRLHESIAIDTAKFSGKGVHETRKECRERRKQ